MGITSERVVKRGGFNVRSAGADRGAKSFQSYSVALSRYVNLRVYMKFSNRQLLNSVKSLNELNNLKLPIKTSFELAKLSRKIDGILKDYQKILNSLQDKHAQKDGAGKKVVVNNIVQFDDKESFTAEFDDLLDCESEIGLGKISLSSFGSVSIEPSLLYHLNWLIEE